MQTDNINKPGHYQGAQGLEAIDVIRNFAGNLTAEQGFYWGNAIKYMLRFQKKNGVEDLKKARKNLDWLIENMEDENAKPRTNTADNELGARPLQVGNKLQKQTR